MNVDNRVSYAILKSDKPNLLEIEVIKFLQEGWKIAGGVSYNVEWECFMQAMVRE